MVIRIESVTSPLDDPELTALAARLIARADAIGLLSSSRVLRTLDIEALRRVARDVAKAGLGARYALELQTAPADRLVVLVQRLSESLEDSPVPTAEWRHLPDVLSEELLARLLRISASSLRRYRAGERETPDAVAERLHFLALLVADLLGAYNEIGVRAWFRRRRSALGGRTPLDVLKGEWTPAGDGPRALRALAESLTDSPAT